MSEPRPTREDVDELIGAVEGAVKQARTAFRDLAALGGEQEAIDHLLDQFNAFRATIAECEARLRSRLPSELEES